MTPDAEIESEAERRRELERRAKIKALRDRVEHERVMARMRFAPDCEEKRE